MLLLLPFALIGLAALFHFLLVASSRAFPLAVAASAAKAAHAAGAPFWAAAIAAALAFILVDSAVLSGGCRRRGPVAGAGWAALVLGPAALAGWSVGALAAAWLGIDPFWAGSVAALLACLIARRRWSAQPV